MAEPKTLEYYYKNGRHVIFDKYIIDTTGNNIINKKSGKEINYTLNTDGYYNASVRDNDGKQCNISIARAVASTFLGKPPTLEHTADHIISNQKSNNDVSNIRWLCKIGQINNRTVPETLKSAFVIVKGDMEMTANEWVEHLKDIINPFGKKYTVAMINHYAQRKQHGFLYKEYPDLEGEVWKRVKNSESIKGHWEISNKSRMKYVTKHASNVCSGEQLGLISGYPFVKINNKNKRCHLLAFEAFYPDVPRGELSVLHKHDNKFDFNPEHLRLGTQAENVKDAYDNGKRDGAKTARMKCASYINGILEKEFESQEDAAEYLRDNGHKKAGHSNISSALSNFRKSAYGRTWKRV
ncbi:hypothetical protein PBCVAP110A_259R [Paramecium bursaria Chlorella virus AP110A]|nr:hypothetical protein PBCVAP110A_259R [Paramecium bursaria Chlorella virus AP110A]